MPFAAALSTNPDTANAWDEVRQKAVVGWNGSPRLGFLFFSPHHAPNMEAIAESQDSELPNCRLIGCMGESIVGNDKEIEEEPALSLWLGQWSSPVELDPFHLALERTPDGHSLFGHPDSLMDADPARSVLFLLADPFSFPIDVFLRQMNEDHPGLRVFGGMCSGGASPGAGALLMGGQVHREGAVGVLVQGDIGVRAVVSQGCRPIGRPLLITKAQENIIAELGGVPPLTHLQTMWKELDARDQQLIQHGLHLGLVMNEYSGAFQRGDFLVRNVLGIDRQSGALAVADRVRVGQTVQFHVRDAETANEDLRDLLRMAVQGRPRPPAAALLFTCNGRGSRLFNVPNHDAGLVRKEAGPIPQAGFFAQGELGPVCGQNYIHGFTASAVLFEEG